MRLALLASTLLAAGLSGAAFAQAPQGAPVRSLTPLAGDLYRYQDNQHFGLVLAKKDAIAVFDPINLAAATWLKGELAARFPGVPVTHVVYSHHDFDHASGAAVFAGAALIGQEGFAAALAAGAPAADAPLSPQQQRQDANKDGLLQPSEAAGPIAANFAKGDENKDGGLTAREAYLAQFGDVVPPTVTFKDGYDLTVGGEPVKLVGVPTAHAADMTYVLFPAEKVLFVVDVLSIRRLPFQALAGYSDADQANIFDKAFALEWEKLSPGHGDVGTRADLEAYRQYYADLEAGVQAGIDKGQTLEQIQASLTLDRYKDWATYAQTRPLNIQGMYAYLTRKE